MKSITFASVAAGFLGMASVSQAVVDVCRGLAYANGIVYPNATISIIRWFILSGLTFSFITFPQVVFIPALMTAAYSPT